MLRRLILAVLAFALVFSAIRAWQDANYGAGPRDSSRAPDAPTREVAIVANAVGGTVTLIDVVAREVLGEVNVIPDGEAVGLFRDITQFVVQGFVQGQGGLNFAQDTDLSRDGRVLFVSRGFLADVIALDLASGEILWRTPISGFRADHMAISPDGTRLYVSALIYGGDKVEVLDTKTGAKRGSFPTAPWPHDVHVSKDGQRIYVASLGDMQADLVDRNLAGDAYRISMAAADTLQVQHEITFDEGIRPFQMTADETLVFAQLSNTHAIEKRVWQTGELLARTDLPVADGVEEEDWDFEAPHHGLALSPDDTTLCAAGRASDYAGLVRADDLTVIATVPTGDAPSWSVIDATGKVCLLANTRSDDVSLVSLSEMRELARLPAGRGPKHITLGLVPEDVIADLAN